MITNSKYRDAFKKFHALNTVKAVIFGLTASLPPVLYPVLCKLMGMTWQVLRTSSARKELKYQVVNVQSDREMDSAIVAHVKHALSSYRSEDHVIAFCHTKHQAHALTKLFNVSPYHAVHQDKELLEKNQEMKQKWLSGENKVMVSTSLLGCGMDYPHICDVIYQNPSFSMLDQYQEDSRGGRDGWNAG